MQIETKFNVGDVVFVPMPTCGERILCPLCIGDKEVLLADGRKILCPECYGESTVAGPSQFVVQIFKIDGLSVWVGPKGEILVTYRFSESRDPQGRWEAAPHETRLTENQDIYRTRAEAEAAAARLQAEAAEHPWKPTY